MFDSLIDEETNFLLYLDNVSLKNINKNVEVETNHEMNDIIDISNFNGTIHNTINPTHCVDMADYDLMNKMPETYNNHEDWIKVTRIKCWNCTLNFENTPITIPKNIQENGDMEIEGIFCSFNCAVRYINDYYHGNKLSKFYNNLLYLYFKFNKKYAVKIHKSPQRYVLKEYGGKIDNKNYQNMIVNLKKKDVIDEPNNQQHINKSSLWFDM
jgi:hypothetical protein